MNSMKTIRFAGAQIPCTPYIALNTQTIKNAIDWAADNNVNYLVTPEASLSGYTASITNEVQLLTLALREIESYAAKKQIGLCLGTLWIEDQSTIRNQIRYYAKDGRYLGATNKTVLTPLDIQIGVVPSDKLIGIVIPCDSKIIPTAGLICADLYGLQNSNTGGLPNQYCQLGVTLIIHSTNADRGIDSFKDEVEDIWLDGNLRRISHQIISHIISVDNCYMMDGTEYHGKTATQSGVLIGGKWVTNVLRTGTQYFYYDFPVDDLILKDPTL